PGKCLAVHAPELVVKPDLQILRRYRRPLLLRLEHAHRSALEDHVQRAPRLGERGLFNVRIGLSACTRKRGSITTNSGIWVPATGSPRRVRPGVPLAGTTKPSSRPVPVSQPGARGLRPLLKARDLVLLDHGEPDIVQALEQAMLAVRIDVELDHPAVGTPDLLLLEVDRQRRIGAALGVVE